MTQLHSFAWTSPYQLAEASKCPEHFEIDATAKTNNEKRPLVFVTGADAFGNSVRWLSAMTVSEQTEQFHWLCTVAMPSLIGRDVLKCVHVALTDGAQPIITSVRTLLATLGNGAVHMLCYWHTVTSNLAQAFSLLPGDDKAKGDIRRLFAAMQKAESDAQFKKYRERVQDVINASNATPTQQAALKEQLVAIYAHRPDWSLAYQKAPLRMIQCLTTSRGEGENSAQKRSPFVHNKARLYINVVVDHHLQQARQRKAREQVRLAWRKIKSDSYPLRDISSSITPLALQLVDEQHLQHQHYDVEAVPPSPTSTISWNVSRPITGPIFNGRTPARIVASKNGWLECSCRTWKQHLIPCRHAIAVNKGAVALHDVHSRWWISSAAGLMHEPRKHGDGECGPSYHSSPSQSSWPHSIAEPEALPGPSNRESLDRT